MGGFGGCNRDGQIRGEGMGWEGDLEVLWKSGGEWLLEEADAPGDKPAAASH